MLKIGELALRTLRDAAGRGHGGVHHAGSAGGQGRRGLAAKIGFADVWNTGRVREGFTKLAPSLSGALAKVNITTVRAFLADNKIRSGIDQAITAFVNTNVGRSMQISSLSGLAADRHRHRRGNAAADARQIEGALGNWLTDLLMPLDLAVPKIPGAEGITHLWERVKLLLEQFRQKFIDVLDEEWAKLGVAEPRDFARVGINSLCTLLRVAISETFQFVSDAVGEGLELLFAAVTMFPKMLLAPLTTGPIVALVNWIARQADANAEEVTEVSLGRLLCLVMAFPVTLGWKLAFGAKAQPFPGGHLLGVGDDAPNKWGQIAGVLQMVYGIFDTAADLMPDDTNPALAAFVSGTALAIEGGILMCTFPNPTGQPFVFVPDTDPTRTARDSHFGCYTAIFLLDVMSFVVSVGKQPKGESGHKLLRHRDRLGKALMTAAGVSAFGCGMWESIVTNTSIASYATNLFTPLSPGFQWVRLDPKNKDGLRAKLVANLFGDGVGGAFRYAAAYGW